MAIEFDIQVRNGTVKITVGGQPSNRDDGSRNTGGGRQGCEPRHGRPGGGIRWLLHSRSSSVPL